MVGGNRILLLSGEDGVHSMTGKWLAAIGVMTFMAVPALAQAQTETPGAEQVVKPELERRNVRAPKIDVDDFEVAVFAGVLSVEDFGANSLYGVRLGYHVTEDLFLEGTYAMSTVSDAAYRRIGAAIFTEPEVDLRTYDLSVGVNLFPGEIFVGKSWATTSAVYLIGGIGNTSFANIGHTTFNFGLGLRTLFADWVAMRIEMRDRMFQSDILYKSELKHNFEFTLGASFYF